MKTLVKALAFVTISVVFRAALNGPIDRAALAWIGRSYDAFAAERIAHATHAAMLLTFAVILNSLFQTLIDGGLVADLGVKTRRANFWNGLFVVLAPAVIVLMVLLYRNALGVALVPAGGVDTLLTIVTAIAQAFLVCGYALQKLLARFGPALAVAIVAAGEGVDTFLRLRHDPEAPLVPLVAAAAITWIAVAIIFCLGRSFWAAVGASFAVLITPLSAYPAYVVPASDLVMGQPGYLLSWFGGLWTYGILAVAIALARKRSLLNPDGEARISYSLPAIWILLGASAFGLMAGERPEANFVLAVFWILLQSLAFLTWLYKIWFAIRGPEARSGPGEAVALMLTPVYNIYWVFQALPGFATDYNVYAERHGVATRLSPAPLIAYVVLALAALIPQTRMVVTPLAFLVGCYVMLTLTRAVNALRA